MKVVYTPKKPFTSLKASVISEKYNCEAYEYFKKKRKDDLTEIVNEINRRAEDKYHLPTL